MAATKIKSIKKRSVRSLIDYCTNPDKTEGGQLVSGLNCTPANVNHEMWTVKHQYGKADNMLAFHAIQSFKPGEITPEIAHKIGVELAQKLWGERFQVVVCTHTDRAHIHNHFVINSVSFLDGKKYNASGAAYKRMQELSDTLCREYALSVIEQPKQGKTKHYAEWQAEKEKRPTWKSTVKSDIDRAIKEAVSLQQFFDILQNEGYEIKFGQDITVKPIGKERGLKLARNFGEQYTLEAIRRRIFTQPPPRRSKPPSKAKRIRYHGIFPLHKKKSFRALYWHYCHLFGISPKSRKESEKRTVPTREDIQTIRNISAEAMLLCKNQIDTMEQLAAYQRGLTEQIEALTADRKRLYNKIRRCEEQDKAAYREQIDALTARIKKLKWQTHLCDDIAERTKGMKLKMRLETQQHEQRKENMKNNEYVR